MNIKPASRFLAAGLVLVFGIALLALAAIEWQMQRHDQARELRDLQSVSGLMSELQQARLAQLALRAHYLASDPAFVDYVTQALVPDPHLGGAIDSASISNLLDERRTGYDSAVVLDPQGRLAARSGMPLRRDGDYRHDPLIAQSLQSRTPASGLWSGNGQLAWVAVEPLLRGAAMQGLLVTSVRIDDAFAQKLAKLSDSEVALLVPAASGATIVASSNIGTLVGGELRDRTANPLEVVEADGRQLAIPAGSDTRLAWATPLDAASGKAALVALPSTRGARSVSTAEPATALRVCLLLLTGLAALVVVLQWKRTYQPLQEMGDIVARAAQGEKFITLRTRGSSGVRRLAGAINGVLRLRER